MARKNSSGVGLMLVEMTIPERRVAQLLCTALEGGVSASWFRVHRTVQAPLRERRRILDAERKDGGQYWPTIDGPLIGGRVIFTDIEDDARPKRTLSRETVRSGLRVMAERYGRHFGDFMAGREDAVTGDVFLQCALLGEVRYG